MKNVVYNRYPLGTEKIKWKQKEFVLSGFAAMSDDMDLAIKNLVENGFNLMESGWSPHEKTWETVEACEKYGLDFIFQDMSVMGGMMNKQLDRFVSADTIKELVESLKKYKHTVGFYVWDEPHIPAQIAEAKRQKDIIMEADPDTLPFTVFPPSYNPAVTWENGLYETAFEHYMETIQPPVVSFDHYPIGYYFNLYPNEFKYDEDYQLDNAYLWADMGVARKLAKKYNVPLWYYYQGSPTYKTTDFLVFPMIRALMYIGAIYGCKGLQRYTVKNDLLTEKGEKGKYFEEQKAIHAEFKALGNTLMALESRLVYHDDAVYENAPLLEGRVDKVEDSSIVDGKLPFRVSVGDLDDAYGNNYLFILNREFRKPLDASIALKGKYNVYEVSKVDGKQRLVEEGASSIKLSLIEGDAALYRVQPYGEELFTCEYKLAD